MKVPQIDIGSLGPYIHESQLIPLPSDTPWGNLLLKSMKVLHRLDHVNAKLELLYRHFSELKSVHGVKYDVSALETEEVVYWLRKSADEFIQLLYVGFCLKRDGAYPKKIEVDSIGRLLQGTPADFYALFSTQAPKLRQLNEVSNAAKHSFLSSEVTLVGRDEPLVFSLAVAYNDLNHRPRFEAIALRDFIEHINQLYGFLKCKCTELFPPKKT